MESERLCTTARASERSVDDREVPSLCSAAPLGLQLATVAVAVCRCSVACCAFTRVDVCPLSPPHRCVGAVCLRLVDFFSVTSSEVSTERGAKPTNQTCKETQRGEKTRGEGRWANKREIQGSLACTRRSGANRFPLIMASPPVDASAAAALVPTVEFNVTGFGEFAGVKSNPTEQLVNSLRAYLLDHPLPAHVAVTSLTVLETSGVGSRQMLHELRKAHAAPASALPAQVAAAVSAEAAEPDAAAGAAAAAPCHRVWLHFGVAAGSSRFALESTSYNCADFRCADQRGWAPQSELIHPTGAQEMCTDLDLPCVAKQLAQSDAAWQVGVSTDPGRFVCNWIYYNSLFEAQGKCDEHSLFIHVPSHNVYNLQQQQQFAREAIIQIAKSIQGGGKQQTDETPQLPAVTAEQAAAQ